MSLHSPTLTHAVCSLLCFKFSFIPLPSLSSLRANIAANSPTASAHRPVKLAPAVTQHWSLPAWESRGWMFYVEILSSRRGGRAGWLSWSDLQLTLPRSRALPATCHQAPPLSPSAPSTLVPAGSVSRAPPSPRQPHASVTPHKLWTTFPPHVLIVTQCPDGSSAD